LGKRGESNRLGIGNVRQKNHKKSLNISKEQKDMDLSKHLTIEHEWLNYDHGGVQQFFGDAMQRILQISMFFFSQKLQQSRPRELGDVDGLSQA